MGQPYTDPETQGDLQVLFADRAQLLDELEMAYRQMERILTAAGHETQITYEELGRRNLQLQQRVAQLERAQTELRETQRMLLHAERLGAMGQMAATIVHEINSPLAVITGHVELMLMGAADESTRSSLNAILEAGWRLRDLARHILHFSRHRHTQAVPVDLSAQAAAVLDFLGPVLRGVEMRAELGAGLPPVVAVPSSVEQVLVNFLMNSRDALEGCAERRICVRTRVAALGELLAEARARSWPTALALQAGDVSPQAQWAVAQVEDSGAGIASEEMSRVFEAFYTTKGEGRGTGLGLAIARNIVQDHGGNILVASRPGAGASFGLLLPLAGAGKPQP
ncbi:MAG: ATP-binding protein [Candidatus Latescibacterota bacterium]